jgi:lipopolysaccharide transport system permease protein
LKIFRSAAPLNSLRSLLGNRELIWALTKRDFNSRYRGSVLGVFWSILQPLLMLGVYTFVFAIALRPTRQMALQNPKEIAIFIFSGLIIFNFFAECLSRSSGLIPSNVNYVKKVVFPIDILPWVSLLTSLLHLTMSFCVWVVFFTILRGAPLMTWLLFPIVLLPLILLTMGCSWFLSATSVYFRDTAQIISVCITVLMFMSPIFYSVSSVPEPYRAILSLSPIAKIIECTRAVLMEGTLPNLMDLGILSLLGLVVFFGGFAWFQATRKGFADVL